MNVMRISIELAIHNMTETPFRTGNRSSVSGWRISRRQYVLLVHRIIHGIAIAAVRAQEKAVSEFALAAIHKGKNPAPAPVGNFKQHSLVALGHVFWLEQVKIGG